MSPSSREINGPRPAPLKIHKDSHQIQKTTVAAAAVAAVASGHQQRQQQPIIIYTHSPKVIHTQARDFMALVQKLTGLSRAPKDDDDGSGEHSDGSNRRSGPKPEPSPPPPCKRARAAREQPGPLSGHGDTANPSAATTFGLDYLPLGIGEIPMFTPGGAAGHFFCSPKSLYRYSSPEAKVTPEF